MDREEVGTPEKNKQKKPVLESREHFGKKMCPVGATQKNRKKEKIETNLLSLMARISSVTFDKRSVA